MTDAEEKALRAELEQVREDIKSPRMRRAKELYDRTMTRDTVRLEELMQRELDLMLRLRKQP